MRKIQRMLEKRKASISVNSYIEMSEAQFFHVGIVKLSKLV